eukprot:364277-Chlamydomonas_euryale.AAC.12
MTRLIASSVGNGEIGTSRGGAQRRGSEERGGATLSRRNGVDCLQAQRKRWNCDTARSAPAHACAHIRPA